MKTRARRERERGGARSFQCAWCWKFYDGPRKGEEPGREAPVSEDVSHGICPECADGELGIPPPMQAELEARHGPQWREKLADIHARGGLEGEGEGEAR